MITFCNNQNALDQLSDVRRVLEAYIQKYDYYMVRHNDVTFIIHEIAEDMLFNPISKNHAKFITYNFLKLPITPDLLPIVQAIESVAMMKLQEEE